MTRHACGFPRAFLLGICAILLAGCGGGSGAPGQRTPEEAFETARKAMIALDWEGMWRVMSDDARDHMADQLRQAKEGIRKAREQGMSTIPIMEDLGLTFADVEAMSTGKQWYLAIGPALAKKSGDGDQESLKKLKVTSVDLDGDKAVLHVSGPDDVKADLRAERTDGAWRINLSDFGR